MNTQQLLGDSEMTLAIYIVYGLHSSFVHSCHSINIDRSSFQSTGMHLKQLLEFLLSLRGRSMRWDLTVWGGGGVTGLLLLSSGWDCRTREAIFIEFAFHILILGMT